ncbi:MAG: nucleotidyltransferase family protein [Pseudomonadales bacterium]|nr:nucleotidyltransferase family protein [Pseudomonadales bacterium]
MTVAFPNGAAVILAAGASTRFGSDKRFTHLDGIPMLSRVVARYCGVFQRVVVVLRPNDPARTLVEGSEAWITISPMAGLGISQSIRAGVESVEDRNWVLLAHGDMPFVGSSALSLLGSALDDSHGPSIVRPSFNDEIGNPVGFTREFFPKLVCLKGDSGARQLLQELELPVHVVKVEDEGVLRDVDTPEQLESLPVA